MELASASSHPVLDDETIIILSSPFPYRQVDSDVLKFAEFNGWSSDNARFYVSLYQAGWVDTSEKGLAKKNPAIEPHVVYTTQSMLAFAAQRFFELSSSPGSAEIEEFRRILVKYPVLKVDAEAAGLAASAERLKIFEDFIAEFPSASVSLAARVAAVCSPGDLERLGSSSDFRLFVAESITNIDDTTGDMSVANSFRFGCSPRQQDGVWVNPVVSPYLAELAAWKSEIPELPVAVRNTFAGSDQITPNEFRVLSSVYPAAAPSDVANLVNGPFKYKRDEYDRPAAAFTRLAAVLPAQPVWVLLVAFNWAAEAALVQRWLELNPDLPVGLLIVAASDDRQFSKYAPIRLNVSQRRSLAYSSSAVVTELIARARENYDWQRDNYVWDGPSGISSGSTVLGVAADVSNSAEARPGAPGLGKIRRLLGRGSKAQRPGVVFPSPAAVLAVADVEDIKEEYIRLTTSDLDTMITMPAFAHRDFPAVGEFLSGLVEFQNAAFAKDSPRVVLAAAEVRALFDGAKVRAASAEGARFIWGCDGGPQISSIVASMHRKAALAAGSGPEAESASVFLSEAVVRLSDLLGGPAALRERLAIIPVKSIEM